MKREKIILVLACAAIFFEAFDVSVVNLSLTAICESLSLTITTGQWLQTVYLVAFGGFLLLGGRLCDYLGPKRVYLSGMFVFGACSLTAAASNQLPMLLLSRGGQGFGAAMAMPAAITLLTTHFEEGDARNRAIGAFGSFAAFGFGLGLACGGIITRYWNWHWIFGINVPVFILIVLTAYRHLPADPLRGRQGVKILSSAWLCLSLLLICFSIHELPRLGWYGVAGILGGGLSLLTMFRHDRGSAAPFFKNGLVTHQSSKAQLASLLLGACFLSYLFLVTRILMISFHLDSRDTGFILFPFSIASAAVSRFILPSLFKTFGVQRTAALSLSVVFVAGGLLVFAVYANSLFLALASLFCMNSFAIATSYPSLTILAVTGIDPADQGSAAGLQSFLYTVGSSIGLSITGLFLQL